MSVGGREEVRKYWPKFVEDTEVLVFVVDAVNKARFPEAYTEMHKLIGDPRLTDKPFIVVANKQVRLLHLYFSIDGVSLPPGYWYSS